MQAGRLPPGYNFNPRPPRGERRCVAKTSYSDSRFQSTPSARRATQAIMQGVYNHIISIHALREEGDGRRHQSQRTQKQNFNPRPPRGGRLTPHRHGAKCKAFQSTPSARRATRCAKAAVPNLLRFQSTPSARRATCSSLSASSTQPNFNPRPPRGGRPVAAGKAHPYHLFQSTPSARRATRSRPAASAPRENFNPRPPRGGRLSQTWENKQY